MSEPLFKRDEARVVRLADETQYATNGIVSRTLFKSSESRLVLFGFDEGQELSEHTSPYHAIVQITGGACQFLTGTEWRDLRAGDLLYMPPDLPHAIRATERFSMLLFLTKDRPRETHCPAHEAPEALCGDGVPDGDFDGRGIPCSSKHGMILDRWESLAPGESFVFINDHDPVPLRYQFEAEFPGRFTWERLETGEPDAFRVRITKLKEPGGKTGGLQKGKECAHGV